MKYRCGAHSGSIAHRVDGSADLAAAELEVLDGGLIRRIRLGTVMGAALSQRFAEEAMERWGVVVEFARSSAAVGRVTNGYADPETLGVDRWLAVLAAYHRWRKAVLVIDLGTATTLDYVDESGQHLGGYIVPGTHLMQSALLKDTAAIDFGAPSQTLAGLVEPGRSTAEAVTWGTLLAVTHLLEGEIDRFGRQYPGGCVGVLCGGASREIVRHLKSNIIVVPELVLDGLSVALP